MLDFPKSFDDNIFRLYQDTDAILRYFLIILVFKIDDVITTGIKKFLLFVE